ncbi:MAG: hypothetical protein J5637_04965 [Prevotella sp.]|nr:hypothetical protein [Prevotella sp.]
MLLQKKLLSWLSLMATAAFAMHGVNVFGQSLNTPLDLGNPVVMTAANAFTYDGKTYPLDEHHLLVDATLADTLAPFACRTFQEAAQRWHDGTAADPMVVYVAPNVYWIDDPDDPAVAVGKDGREPFGMTVRCQNLHLIGLTHDPRNVVLASQRGQTQGAVGNFTMFDFHGDGLEVSNLTMGNYCNVDLDYPLSPTLGRRKRSDAITQAHVAYCHGDRVVARNVRFISRLNMNPLNGARRILFDHCHFECTDDALTGNGVYVHCDFEFYGQKPFYTTSRTGAVMLDCDFRLMGDNDRSYFCKASGAVTLVDCRFHAHAPTYLGWTAYPAPWLRCYYSNVTYNGKPYLIEREHPETSVCLDGKPALMAYKTGETYRVDGLLAGDDQWHPMGQAEARPLPTMLSVVPRQVNLRGGDAPVALSATSICHGGYAESPSENVVWKVETGHEKFLRMLPAENGRCQIVSDYDEDTPLHFTVVATTPDGLESAMLVNLEGKPLPSPTLKRKPKVVVRDGVATLRYQLSPEDHADQSVITWLLADTNDPMEAIPVATSHRSPETTYHLKACDAGKYLFATITPAHARSAKGRTYTAGGMRVRTAAPHLTLETDFHDFPCQWQPLVKEGFWTVDGFKPADTAEYPWSFDPSRPMWEYGEGYNGAVGWGLLQAQRGARMMFTPPFSDYGNMRAELDVDPTKTAGQGFGSATGQYMDIGLKFDTQTLSGYALRIIRTTKYAKAVDFLLVRYDQGRVVPVTQPVSATCYRTGCHIVVDYADGTLTADVTTDTPLAAPTDPALHTVVHLSATVEPNPFGGFCLQHTGSCGESTTMLHHLRLQW